TSFGRSSAYRCGAAPSCGSLCPARTKNVEPVAPRRRSSAAICSKRQFGSVPRSLCQGAIARPVASRTAGVTRGRRTLCLRREAAPRTPTRVQRHGESTSCVRATTKGGGSAPRLRRSRSTGGAGGGGARPLGAEAAVLVARAVPLLHPREVEEAGGQVVGGTLPAVDLFPCSCVRAEGG